jgi:hypothetical protein
MQLKKGESKFEQAKAGKQPGVIAKFEDIGVQETKFGDRAQCRIVYVLAECDASGRQKRISQTLTASLNEKAKLSAVLTKILGSVPEEFDSEVLIGKQVILTFGTIVKDGQERTRLYDVEAAPEGQNVQFSKRRSA